MNSWDVYMHPILPYAQRAVLIVDLLQNDPLGAILYCMLHLSLYEVHDTSLNKEIVLQQLSFNGRMYSCSKMETWVLKHSR